MRTWLWLTLFSLLFTLPWITAPAQNANNDDVEFSVLQGTVKFPDGTPYRGVSVTIKMGGKEMTPAVTTDENGNFSRILPAGEAIITVSGIEKTVKLVAGEQTTVSFEIKQTGVNLTIIYADKTTPTNIGSVGASYKTADKRESTVSATMMTQGKYWIKDIPANATALSVVIRSYANGRDNSQRQQWTFDKAEDLRQLTMTMEKPVAFSLIIVDAAGAPVPNAQVKGMIYYTYTYMPYWYPEGGNAPYNPNPNRGNFQVSNHTADANGLLNLGSWAVGKYDVSLRTDSASGPQRTIELKATGADPVKYALNLQPRDLTQTVFNTDRKPVPNTPVYASYCWKGKAIFAQAKSDAAGKVTWKSLPPVRTIVWGKGVQAGVIPADAAVVDAPLTPPTQENNRYLNLNVKLSNAGDQPLQLICGQYRDRDNLYPNEVTYSKENNYAMRINGNSGQITSFVAVTKTEPTRIACLSNVYLPYTDEGDSQETTLELQNGITLKGRLVSKLLPVGELNQFRIIPVKLSTDLSPQFVDEMLRKISIMRPTLKPDGTFKMVLPCPGSYRAIVDLYDETTQSIPELLVNVPAEGLTTELKLPDPFFKVPAGTNVCWVTRNAPRTIRSIVATAGTNPMPVFAPKDQLLLCWFRPTPDKMIIWNAIDRQQQTLSLRSLDIHLVDKDGKPLLQQNASMLLPLLPTTGGNYPGSYYDGYGGRIPNSSNLYRACSESTAIPLGPDLDNCQAIWTGKYLVSTNSRVLVPVEIPAVGPRDITITIPPAPENPRMQNRSVRIKYTKGDLEQLRKNASERISTIYDDNFVDTNNGLSYYGLNDGRLYNMPLGAKTVTLYWPGVGFMKNLPLPTDDQTVLELPAWDAGAAVSGKILMPDGKPYANKPLSIAPSLDTQNIWRVNTDAQGAFSIKGFMPGALYIYTQYDNNAGWTVEVPAKGLTDLKLQMSSSPVRISGGGDRGQVWWFPDGGKPMRLPTMSYYSCAVHDLAPGSGWIWNVSTSPENCTFYQTTLRTGDSYYGGQPNTATAIPSLALYLPLDTVKGYPRGVTISALDEGRPFRVSFQANWQVSSLLGKFVFQINALPPGKYKVTVDTTTGNSEATVAVTEHGASVDLSYPVAPAAPAVPAAPAR